MNEQDKPDSLEFSSPLDRLIAKSQQAQAQDNSNTPHPLIVAERWGFNLSYVDVDGDPQHYLYHAVQWVQGLGAKDSRSWRDIKEQFRDTSPKLKIEIYPYISTDGKTYQVEFITQESCYLVAQEMRITSTRPQLAEIKTYLAKVGVIFDDLRRGDATTTEWFKARLEGVKVRKSATQIYTETHVIHKPNIPALTNTTYHYLFQTQKQETAKKEIVKTLGLTRIQAKNLRDHLHTLALLAIHSAEGLAAEKMRLTGYPLEDKEQLGIVAHAARIEAKSYMEKCDWLKIDPITGEKVVGLTQYDYE